MILPGMKGRCWMGQSGVEGHSALAKLSANIVNELLTHQKQEGKYWTLFGMMLKLQKRALILLKNT